MNDRSNSSSSPQAPTRPLVSQQIEACYDVVAIPPADTADITGKLSKDKRMELWKAKRVFFATPQVIQNDIKDRSFPAHAIKLVIVDEAHKAKGKFAYCEVIREIMAVHSKFRVMALTATPGKPLDVIEINQNLLISKIECRTENSIDTRKYAFEKSFDIVTVPLGFLSPIRSQYLQILEVYTRKLMTYNVISGNNFSKGWLIIQKKRFLQTSHPQKSEISKIFSIVVTLVYSLDLLERHGIHNFLNSFTDETNRTKLKYFVSQDKDLRKLIDELKATFEDTNPLTTNINPLPSGAIPSIIDKNLNFGHPKYDILKSKLTEYFNNGGNKVIIFCEFRETAALIFTLLLQMRPVVQPRKLIGQRGAVSQKDQMIVMKDFRSNIANVLVATSVGEEGIDIGEVDLVIMFDSNTTNPTRFVQRSGRTGRKRAGKVLILATEGQEQEVVKSTKGSKDRWNKSIHTNKEITKSLYKSNQRLIPSQFNPKCVEVKFKIPEILPEVKTKGRSKKATTKVVTKKKPPSQGQSIATHFQSKTKPQEEEILENVEEPAEVEMTDVAPALNFSANQLCEKAKSSFESKTTQISLIQLVTLSHHLKADSKNVLTMMNNLIEFVQGPKDDDLSSLELEYDDTLGVHLIQEAPKSQIESDTKVEAFIEVESRYGNQFPIPKPFNSPLKSSPLPKSPFPTFNGMLTPNTSKTGLNNKKNAPTWNKKSPIENSPLMKAFEKQRNLSTSTPVTSRLATPIFNRTSNTVPTKVVPRTFKEGSSNQLQSGSEHSKSTKNKTVLEFFGIRSIDDIFEGLSSDDENQYESSSASSKHISSLKSDQSSLPTTTNATSIKIANPDHLEMLEEDDDLFLNIDEGIVESSVIEEHAKPPNEKGKNEINLENIFGSSSEDELNENAAILTNDLSQGTETYSFDDVIEVGNSVEMEMKENVLIVNHVVIDSPSPKKMTPERLRPNFGKLMSALKSSSNFLTPRQNIPHDSPVSKRSSLFGETSFKSPNVTTPKTSKFLSPTLRFLQSPCSSRVIAKAAAKQVVIDSDDSNESANSPISYALPVRRKIVRKRKRNDFFDTQAGVDGEESSDEDEDDDLDGFIINNTVDLSQGDSIDMHAKYLESLRSPSARQMGNFKIPQLKAAPNRSAIFSQMPNEDDEEDDWEMDSFIVDGTEALDEEDSEVDELELAEQRLKENRKKARQLKNGAKRRKVLRSLDSSDEDEGLKRLRMEVVMNQTKK